MGDIELPSSMWRIGWEWCCIEGTRDVGMWNGSRHMRGQVTQSLGVTVCDLTSTFLIIHFHMYNFLFLGLSLFNSSHNFLGLLALKLSISTCHFRWYLRFSFWKVLSNMARCNLKQFFSSRINKLFPRDVLLYIILSRPSLLFSTISLILDSTMVYFSYVYHYPIDYCMVYHLHILHRTLYDNINNCWCNWSPPSRSYTRMIRKIGRQRARAANSATVTRICSLTDC